MKVQVDENRLNVQEYNVRRAVSKDNKSVVLEVERKGTSYGKEGRREENQKVYVRIGEDEAEIIGIGYAIYN